MKKTLQNFVKCALLGGALAFSSCEQPVKTITVVEQVQCEDESHQDCDGNHDVEVVVNRAGTCDELEACLQRTSESIQALIDEVSVPCTVDGCDGSSHILARNYYQDSAYDQILARKGGMHESTGYSFDREIYVMYNGNRHFAPCLTDDERAIAFQAGLDSLDKIHADLGL